MANAIIDTLKAKNTSGEEVIIYPRTTFDAVRDDEGKTLDVILSELNNGSDGGFNEVYGETFISMGRKEGTTVGKKSIAFGDSVTATGSMSVAFGYDTKATGAYSMATGYSTEATGWESHAEGYYTKASGDYSHAEGLNNTAEGYASHSEGKQNTVSGDYAHAEGYSNTASNTSAHAEGNNTTASGAQSHAEGFFTVASAWLAHAEGDHSEASGSTSHAEGNYTKASGDYSHAEGSYSEAKGYYSHVEGSYTIASGESQHVQGKYNVEDTENKYAHIVGGGESTSKRKNIHTLDWEGNAVFAGDVTDGNGDSIASVKALIQEDVVRFSATKVVEYTDDIYEVANAIAQESGSKDPNGNPLNITKDTYPYLLAYSYMGGTPKVYFAKSFQNTGFPTTLKVKNFIYFTAVRDTEALDGADIENVFHRIVNCVSDNLMGGDSSIYTITFSENIITPIYTNFDLHAVSPSITNPWYVLSGNTTDYGTAGQYMITNGDGTVSFADSAGSGMDVMVPTKVSELENDAGYIKASDLPNIDTDITVPTKVSELENDIGYITADDLTTLDGETIYSTERKTLEVTAYADTVIDSITLPAGTYYVQGMFQYSGTDLRYLQRLRANNTSFANMSLYDNAGVVVGCISGICELDSESIVDYQVYLNKRDESSNPATCELKFVSMTAARISSGVTIENSTDSHIVDYSPAIKSVNHRGYSADAPENTLPAYILSKQKGFDYAECDVAFTSDGVAVLLHDGTIDRTSNGSGNVSSLTYEQLLTYDFGSWFSAEYTGTKIPTFEEFIKLCKQIGLHPYIELKSSGSYTQEQITSIVDMVKANGMKGKVTYISFNADFLGYVKSADPAARLGYLSSTATDNVITTVTSLRSGSNEVYAGVNYTALTDNFISNCIVDSIPLEIWTVNDVDYIRNMNGYISGVTSDSLIAGDILRSEYIDSVGTIGFPTDENGTANHGVAGQFLVSNGDGTVSFVDGVTNTSTFTDGELKPWLYDTSGEEVVIGVYDGKPVYRKYFKLNVKTVDGLTTFPISDYVSNYEKIINHKMYTTSGNILNEIHAQQGTTDNQNWICYFVNVGMGLIQVTCSTTRNALDYIFTCMMEYTKTTDAEGSGNNMTPYGVYCTTQVSGELKPWLYSTEEEVIVGVYKGKPLYRKCYDITGITLTADKFYVHPTGLSNVERYVSVNGALVNDSNISASSLPQEKHTDVQGITLLVNESLGGIHISASKDNALNENVHWLIILEYTKTTDAEGSGNSLNPYGIYNSKLDDIEARLSAFESIVVAEGGAY